MKTPIATAARRILRASAVASFSLAATTTCFAASEIIANGSFESGLAGWTSSGNVRVQPAPPPYSASDGSRLVVFNAGNTAPNGILSQTLATIPGQAYSISLDIGILAYNFAQQRLEVEVAGDTPRLFAVSGNGDGKCHWLPKSFTFTAVGFTTQLTFRDRSSATASVDLLLDHISVSTGSSAVLTVESALFGGVPVTLSPPDLNGFSGTTTNFVRTYQTGAIVDLSVPASLVVVLSPYKVATMRFQYWMVDGVTGDSQRGTRLTMDANHTLVPVYQSGPPIIVGQPVSVEAVVGNSVSFHVTVDAPGTHYLWRHNGHPIEGALYDTYNIPSAGFEDEGTYDVILTDFGGAVTSEAATLTVREPALVNGGFEDGGLGWHAQGNVRFIAAPIYPSTEGRKVANFNGGDSVPNGVIWQEFATVPGMHYLLTCDSGILSFLPVWQTMGIVISGNESGEIQFSERGDGKGVMQWFHVAIPFVAANSITRITFVDTSEETRSIDLCLDHLQLFAMPVPHDSSWVEAGSFLMGSPPEELGRYVFEDQHSVQITRPFQMKRTEVTWAEWNRIRNHAAEFGYTDIGPGQNGTYGDASGSHPVTKVSWWDAIKWCNLRSELVGLTPVYLDRPGNNAAWSIRTGTPQVHVNWEGNGYRLPTEAEWEYACRARTNTAFYTGAISTWYGRSDNLDRAGWNYWNSGDTTHPVGLKEPNSFGIFDMHGNVYEWCWDWFGYYPAGWQIDPLGAGSGTDRVIRGGSWSVTPNQCRSAFRTSEPPDIAIDFMGFRPVRGGTP